MSDLISRSELINALKVHFDSCFREDGELLYSDHICTSDDVVDLIKLVENQPTAYSVDKVVRQLNLESVGSSIQVSLGLLRAIEIVKQGGVSDDVCEWKSDYGLISDKYKRETSCGYTFYDLHHAVPFKFCPYCGKKIKVVE